MSVNPSRDEYQEPGTYDPYGANRVHQHQEEINVWHRDLTKGWDWVPECGCTKTTLCFKHKLKTIQFNGKGKGPKTQEEARWAKDMPAYARLRANGLQPKQINGCAELETRAKSQTEVEMGHIFPKDVLPKVEEGMAIARDLEWTPKVDEGAVRGAKDRRLEGRK